MTRLRLTDLLTRVALAVIGALSVYVALDSALGGTATLGFQIKGTFLVATDPQAYAVRDSHVRFLGAVWGGIGVVFLAGAIWTDQLRDTLLIACGLGLLGGLARFSAMGPGELVKAGLGISLAIELIVLPLLAASIWWRGPVGGRDAVAGG
ncbi:MAG: DUF4345 family protein [Paracoccaceae bacterium]